MVKYERKIGCSEETYPLPPEYLRAFVPVGRVEKGNGNKNLINELEVRKLDPTTLKKVQDMIGKPLSQILSAVQRGLNGKGNIYHVSSYQPGSIMECEAYIRQKGFYLLIRGREKVAGLVARGIPLKNILGHLKERNDYKKYIKRAPTMTVDAVVNRLLEEEGKLVRKEGRTKIAELLKKRVPYYEILQHLNGGIHYQNLKDV